jgi:hypothetical protein
MRRLNNSNRPVARRRRGAATLDYVLVLGIVFALAALVIPTGMTIIRAAYDMLNVLIAWPFL